MKYKSYGAAQSGACSEADPTGVHHINAHAGNPASACQTPAAAGVKPDNTNFHDYGRDY